MAESSTTLAARPRARALAAVLHEREAVALARAAFAITTATYGSSSAATIRIGHSQWIPASEATIAPTKHSGTDAHGDQVALLARRDVLVAAGRGGGDADRLGSAVARRAILPLYAATGRPDPSVGSSESDRPTHEEARS